jgi:FkbM family methyltransferase
MGWKGICVEPHPDYFRLLKENRRGSVTIQAAAGKEDKGSVDFYTNFRGSMSTLDKSLEGFFRSHYGNFFGGFKVIQVPLVTLNTLLERNGAPVPIDILSIDTEGTEEDVMRGFDFKHYAPRVVIAEISIRKEPVLAYLEGQGYVFACSNPSNAIFCKSGEDAELVRRTNVEGTQLAPPHPLETKS